jgi:hypothetical protein
LIAARRYVVAVHLGQVAEAHHLVLDTKARIVEATLRNPARERHLAALEAGLPAARAMVPRTRLAAFMSLASCLSRARSGPAAQTLPIPV